MLNKKTIAIIIAWAFIRAHNPDFTLHDLNKYGLFDQMIVVKKLDEKNIDIELGVKYTSSGAKMVAVKINPIFKQKLIISQ